MATSRPGGMAQLRYHQVRIAAISYSSPRNNWPGAIPKPRWPDCPSAAVRAWCLRHPISPVRRRRSAAPVSAVGLPSVSRRRRPTVHCWPSSRRNEKRTRNGRMDLDGIVADFEKDSALDYIGLWELVRAVTKKAEKKDDENIPGLTFTLLRKMLARGFRAGGFTQTRKWEFWSGQNPDHVIRRIGAEWDALGREPNIGDIVWFERSETN